MRKPQNHERVMLIDIGSAGSPQWERIAAGILSRANNIQEETEENYYMDGKGSPEVEPTSQKVSTAYTGHRTVGDPAQDYILEEILYKINRRSIEFIDYDLAETESGKCNGYKGKATITITDFGSGDAKAKQNIAFTLNYNGVPERGTVEYNESTKQYTFTPKV